jgi:hypothetical protein
MSSWALAHWRRSPRLCLRLPSPSTHLRPDIPHGGGLLSYHVNQSAGSTCRQVHTRPWLRFQPDRGVDTDGTRSGAWPQRGERLVHTPPRATASCDHCRQIHSSRSASRKWRFVLNPIPQRLREVPARSSHAVNYVAGTPQVDMYLPQRLSETQSRRNTAMFPIGQMHVDHTTCMLVPGN